jgi:pimeloyl-ACP methyl ester carboxylesterase
MRLANSRLVLYATLFATKFLGRFSSRLAGLPVSLLWFTPWRVPVSDRGLKKQAGWLEPTQPFTLRTSVGRIAGFTAGEGPVVVLVHGWGERAAALGGFIAPLTAAGFRVVGLDLPAHGDSARQMTNPIIAGTAIREVADHFGGAHAVIAHSFGANAVLLAIDAGLKVERLVFIAPNTDSGDTIGIFQSMFGLPNKAMDGLRRKIERRYGPLIWRDINGEHLARRLCTPGLVFHDPHDPQVPFGGAHELVRAWKQAELIETPGLGHGPVTRDPDVIKRAVDFVAQVAFEPTLTSPS